MKKLTILLCLVSFNLFNSFGQNCKYSKNETDKFTKKEILITKPTTLWSALMSAMAFKAIKINNFKYLQMKYATTSIFSVNKGSKLMFLLNNDSIVKLITPESKTANYKTSKYATIWSASINYELSEADYEILLNGIVKSIRFYTPKGYIEKQIKPNRSKNFYKILRCI